MHEDTAMWIILFIIIALALTALCITGISNNKALKRNYEETLKNPPKNEYIVNDLTDIFLTNQIEVVGSDKNMSKIIYEVVIDKREKYYVLYEVKQISETQYEWLYMRHRDVGEVSNG